MNFFRPVLLIGAITLAQGPGAFGVAHVQAAGTGSISGSVTDGNGTGLGGICVNVGPSGTQTDPAGSYVISGLDAGTYQAQYSDCNATPLYVTQWYLGHADQNNADQIPVSDGADTPLQSVVLQAGVSVSGTVTDTSGNPLAGINVNVNPTGAGVSSWAQTDGTGAYTTGAVPTGDYRVQFSDPSLAWATQFWQQQPSWSTAQVLSLDVAAGNSRTGIDAQLTAAATIAGTVTGVAGVPVEGVCVAANVSNNNGGWDNLGQTTTDANGVYVLGGLAATDVRVQFRDCNPTPQYLEQWFDGGVDFNSSSAITLAEGENRQGVDAELVAGISIAGTVTDTTGAPIQGINVNVNSTGSGQSAWAQTDAAGNYVTGAVAAGDYRVQFSASDPAQSWATQFWDEQVSWNTSNILTVSTSDTPIRGGVDAVLSAAATVTGTVTDAAGQPVAGVCVNAVINTPNGLDGLANATTAVDGTYRLSGMAPIDVKIRFNDCNHSGPYVTQWWHGEGGYANADTVTLSAGATTTGVDAQLAAAASIVGTVTDTSGTPLANICVQASTSSFVGNLTQTDNNGNYTLEIGLPGSYRVQFVDCNQPSSFAATWWGIQSDGSGAAIIVNTGDTVAGIDAALTAGAAGSISGTVVNAHGTAMVSVCAIAYLPTQFAVIAAVNPDGTYSIDDVPSGTYALAFVGCAGGQPSADVVDPDDPSLHYQARWWLDAPLQLTADTDGGPDPILQSARLVTVAPGAHLDGYDTCFGCVAPAPVITVDNVSISVTLDSLTVSFTVSGPTPAPADTYTVTCTSPTGGAPRTGHGTSSPITVTGLTAGVTYTCQLSATNASTTPASFQAEVPAPAVDNSTQSTQPSNSPADESEAGGPSEPDDLATIGTLPATGNDPNPTLALAAIVLGAGLLIRMRARTCEHRARTQGVRDEH